VFAASQYIRGGGSACDGRRRAWRSVAPIESRICRDEHQDQQEQSPYEALHTTVLRNASALCAKRRRSTGRVRKRTPHAAKIALPRAGAAIAVPTSPSPPGGCELSTQCTSICGASLIRRLR